MQIENDESLRTDRANDEVMERRDRKTAETDGRGRHAGPECGESARLYRQASRVARIVERRPEVRRLAGRRGLHQDFGAARGDPVHVAVDVESGAAAIVERDG